MARETLGSLMGKPDSKNDSIPAAEAYAPETNPDTTIGVGPDLRASSKDALFDYTQKLAGENRFSPNPVLIETPSNELTPGESMFFTALDLSGKPLESTFTTISGGGVVDNNQGAQFTSDTLGKFLEKNSDSTTLHKNTGHGLLISEGDGSPVPAPGNAPNYARPSEDTRPIAAAVYDALERVNKYSPSDKSPYLDPTLNEEKAIGFGKGAGGADGGLYSLQTGELGVFNPDRTNISVKELRGIAMEMLLKAQSISLSDSESAAKSVIDEGKLTGLDKMALIPHMTQIGGGRISATTMRARNANAVKLFLKSDGVEIAAKGQDDLIAVQSFETVLGAGGGDSPFSLDKSVLATSFGTMNSPAEPFDGAFPGGMVMPVIFSMIVVGLFGSFILPAAVSQMGDSDSKRIPDPNSPWDLAMGSNVTKAKSLGDAFLEFFGVPRGLGQSFFGSLMAGIMTFYGLPTPITPLSIFGADLLTSLLNLVMAPGFYLVITKGILRDIEQITNAFGAFGEPGGVFGFFSSLFGAIEAISTSFTFRFFMIMCQVGRQVMSSLTDDFPDANYVSYDEQAETKLTPEYKTMMTRWHASSNLFEGVISPLSLMAQPALLINAGNLSEVPQFDSAETLETGVGINQVHASDGGGSPGRITREMVDEIEKIIDNEYMPFSIHDLRTNEVISLPAFISRVSDDFSASYSTTQGYGRTDPVYAYSKTVRTVGMTFNLVAMNKKDHHYMWFIVNKLVTMMYPQRDIGKRRMIGTGEGAQHFIQPFSQSPTASPFVRIRLGDLLHSNSWSENQNGVMMKKLFGGDAILGLPGTTTSEDFVNQVQTNLKFIRGYKKAREEIIHEKLKAFPKIEFSGDAALPKGTTVLVEYKDKFALIKLKKEMLWTFDSSKTEEFAKDKKGRTYPGDNPDSKKSSEKCYVIKPKLGDLETDAKVGLLVGGRPLATLVHAANATSPLPFPLPVGGTLKFIVKGSVKVKMIATETEITSKLTLTEGDVQLKDQTTVDEFMKAERNPVIKAFEGTKGRGLGGVITQMSLGYDNATWGTDKDARLRAPKKVEITLQFAPVHDLPLGLDYSGEVFAPSHPVGPYSSKAYEDADFRGAPGPEETYNLKHTEITEAAANVALDTDKLKDPTEDDLPF